MKYHTKIVWEQVGDPIIPPSMLRQEVACPKCNWRLPVPFEFTDWKLVADKYRSLYLSREEDFFKVLVEAGEVFDVPLVEYFKAHQMDLFNRIHEMMERLNQKTDDELP